MQNYTSNGIDATHIAEITKYSNSSDSYPQTGLLITMNDLQEAYDAGFQSVSWIVGDLIPKGALSTIYGHGGTGKSLLALDLALHVAGGAAEWMGLPVMQNGSVVLVDTENLPIELHIERLCKLCGTPKAGPSNLYIIDADKATKADDIWGEIHCIRPALVIIDSLSGYMGGGDMNEQRVVVPTLRELAGHARELGSGMLLIDHVSKADSSTERETVLAYGSVFKYNYVRTAMHLRRVEDVMELTTTKNNLSPAMPTFQVRMLSGERLVFECCTMPTTGRRGAIVACLQAKGIATLREIVDYIEQEGFEAHLTTVRREIERMVASGIVRREGRDAQGIRYRIVGVPKLHKQPLEGGDDEAVF